MIQMNADGIGNVTGTVCVSHRGPGKNMCAVSAITDVYFTRCFQEFFHSVVKYRSGLLVGCSLYGSVRTGPLAAHQPEPVFTEAERDGPCRRTGHARHGFGTRPCCPALEC